MAHCSDSFVRDCCRPAAWLRLARTGFACSLALCSTALLAATETTVVKAEFGVFEDSGTDQLGFGATADIPLTPGQRYGWLLEVKTQQKSLAIREEWLAPQDGTALPADEPLAQELTPRNDKVTLMGLSERRLPVIDGMVFGEQKILPHQRAGNYRLRLFVEKQLAASFDYRLQAPDLAPPAPASPAAEAAPKKKPTPKKKPAKRK